jgi:LmbE family N-acetylglucosaminyl deacetylase
MVMSGSGERVVFVFDNPGDEVLSSGGTIARLRSEGAQVAVLFGSPGDMDEHGIADGALDAVSDAVRSSMDELDVRDWRMLHAAPDQDDSGGDRVEEAIGEVVARVKATAVVVGSTGMHLVDAAIQVGLRAEVPVYVATRLSGSHADRVTAIDIEDHLQQKLRALAAYSRRWTVNGSALVLPDGTVLPISEFETYVAAHPPRPLASAQRSTGLARFGRSLGGLAVGVTFGILGTIGHQSTVAIGPVSIPVGLILALGGAVALLVGLRLLVGDRVIVFSCALGMLATIFLLSLRSAGGSVLIPAGLPGTLWSVTPALVAALVLAWPKLPAKG